ncbi:hypothetical protein H4S08_000676 [Coemansia sp. RSA 1365]|nr:hypothetical protein H4S08_000676 [Coemansia sp. RSA 1365]
MEALFDNIDENVETAIRTLFPPAAKDLAAKDAQQRAQAFCNQVTVVHRQLTELKSKMDETPNDANTSKDILEKEISELRQDIQLKEEILAKYRKIMNDHIDRLKEIDQENRKLIEGM